MNLEIHQASKLNRRIKRYIEATGRGHYPDLDLSPDLLEVVKAKAKLQLEHARAECRFWSGVLFYVDKDIVGLNGNGHHHN
jgi:hypothetical protein